MAEEGRKGGRGGKEFEEEGKKEGRLVVTEGGARNSSMNAESEGESDGEL